MAQLVEQKQTANPQLAHYVAEYRRSVERGDTQPAWLVQARESAIARFERLGFPTTRDEQWRFTSVAPIAERTFARPDDGVVELGRQQSEALSSPAAHAVCVNGRFVPGLSRLTGLPKGVQILGLEAALAAHPAMLEPYLARLCLTQPNAFTSLNTAFLEDGIVLLVDRHVVVEQPIEITFVSAAEEAATVSHPRLLIIAGEGSQTTILERYLGVGQTFTNAVGEVWLGANAVVDHYKLQEEAEHSFHIASMFLHIARSGNFSSHSLTFGGGLVRNDVIATLDGEGVDCTLNGLYVARGSQLVDNHTTIDHARPHCDSHEVYKGVLGDKSRAVFNGKIIVRPDAQKTDAKQTNKALLLSDHATINTKPELEIFANDVKCTHGAAVGQLDDTAMFYLRSRGLGMAESRAMLVHAFASDILNRVKIEPVRNYLEDQLTARLPHVD